MFWRGDYFFWRETADGRREIGWRTWVLIWVLPGLLIAAAVLMTGYETYRHLTMVPAEGEVVRVYSSVGETPFDRGVQLYAPVFRYTWSDGRPTEASAGMRHHDWNFEVGTRHAIRYDPRVKRDVLLPGAVNFYAGLIVGALGLVTALLALFATWRLIRWRRGGTR